MLKIFLENAYGILGGLMVLASLFILGGDLLKRKEINGGGLMALGVGLGLLLIQLWPEVSPLFPDILYMMVAIALICMGTGIYKILANLIGKEGGEEK